LERTFAPRDTTRGPLSDCACGKTAYAYGTGAGRSDQEPASGRNNGLGCAIIGLGHREKSSQGLVALVEWAGRMFPHSSGFPLVSGGGDPPFMVGKAAPRQMPNPHRAKRDRCMRRER
jgi:hypothetical protein